MPWVVDCPELAEAANMSPQVAERWQAVAPYLERAAQSEAATSGMNAERFESLLMAVAWVESRFNPAVTSNKGAQGLMQVIPQTGKFAAAKLGLDSWRPWNVEENAMVGAWYLARVLHRFRTEPIEWGIAAYNAGPGAVAKRGPMAAQGQYPHTVLRAELAIRQTKQRCEQGGGGIVPSWPYPKAAKSTAKPKPTPTPTPGPTPAEAGGGLAVVIVVVLALLFGTR